MIRSITIGLPLQAMSTSAIASRTRTLLRLADERMRGTPFEPRTKRYTLPTVGAEGEEEGVLLSRLRWVDEFARSSGVRWFCFPVDLVPDLPRKGRLSAALDAVTRFDRAFLNLIIASHQRMAPNAALDAARLILDVARKSNNGFDNFRVGASCNCPPNAPFFPSSRHEGDHVAFAFALETTPLAMEALAKCPSPHDIGVVRDALVEALREHLSQLDALGRALEADSGAEYRGLDASFAPLPSEDVSVAALIEHIIGISVGSSGSVFATAFLTDALRTAVRSSGVKTVGYNGVMFSVLEDKQLAMANNQRRLTLDALLTLATVCACGLDMIPVPGLSFPEEIAALMLDIAALSCAHHKPLGIRLLPIPNGYVNELTRLNLDFLCDSRIIGLSANDRRLETRDHVVSFRSPRLVTPELSGGG